MNKQPYEKVNLDGPQENSVPKKLGTSTPTVSEKKSRALWSVDPVLAPEYELNMRYTQLTADGPKVPSGTPTPTGAENTTHNYDKPRVGPTNVNGQQTLVLTKNITEPVNKVPPLPTTKGYDPIIGGRKIRVNDSKTTTINRGQQ